MIPSEREIVYTYLVQDTAARLPNFETSELTVNPSSVEIGVAATISVKVDNTGGASGSHEIELEINGIQEEIKTITVDAGESTIVQFDVNRDQSGVYEVVIDELEEILTVTQPPEQKPEPKGIPGFPIIGLSIGLIFSILLLRRNRSTPYTRALGFS